MRISPDTNLLVRIAVKDDSAQARRALKVLKQADLVAIATVALCEVAWVLRKVYRFAAGDIHFAIGMIISPENVVVDRVAVDAGMQALETGCDFADAVIALEGARMGGDTFISFDREAVRRCIASGRPAKLLI